MATSLSFGAELDDEQRETARKIVQRALDLGLNDQQTRLAVAVAYQESRLRPNVGRGQDGEIGLMQVMPSTGKQFGFSVEDLRDPDRNIDAGLTVLKSQLDQYPKNPRLAIIGYNKGPDAKFFSGGELPQVTKDYLRDLTAYGAFEVPQEPEKSFVEKSSEAADQLATKAMEDESLQAAAIGAGTGLVSGKIFPDEGFPRESTTGLERGVTRRRLMLEQLEREFAGLPESARAAPPSVPEPSPIQLDVERAPPSQTGLERQIQGGIDPESGQTGRARQTGYNELSAQRAAQQRQQAAVEAALRQRGAIAGPSPFATTPISSTPSGILVPPQVATEAAAPAAQAQAEAQRAASLQNQINTARRNLTVSEGVLSEARRSQPGVLAKAGAAFRSPMAKMIPGALTGLEVAEAGRRYEEGDYLGSALAGGAALGGGLMVAPTMPGYIGAGQKTLGALLQYGGGLGLLLHDIMQNKNRQKETPISATR
jgi:hypothetical protein